MFEQVQPRKSLPLVEEFQTKCISRSQVAYTLVGKAPNYEDYIANMTYSLLS